MGATQQKPDLRALIHEEIERFLTEHPEQARAVAMGMTRSLSAILPVEELEQWYNVVCVMSQVFDDASTLEARFWEKVEKTNGCWLWTGVASGGMGYGQIKGDGGRQGRMRMAHRVSWELAYGPIPEGMWVLHRCDNPRCVRPDHLFLGTHTDNMRDARDKGRLVFVPRPGEKNPNAKLTNSQAAMIRASPLSQRKLARVYGVSHETIGRIKRGETYKEA